MQKQKCVFKVSFKNNLLRFKYDLYENWIKNILTVEDTIRTGKRIIKAPKGF